MQEVIDYFAGKAIIWLDGSCELETGFYDQKYEIIYERIYETRLRFT